MRRQDRRNRCLYHPSREQDRLGVPYWKVRRLLTCMPAEDACLEVRAAALRPLLPHTHTSDRLRSQELYLSLSWDGPLGLTFTKTFPRTLRHLTLDLAPIWGHR